MSAKKGRSYEKRFEVNGPGGGRLGRRSPTAKSWRDGSARRPPSRRASAANIASTGAAAAMGTGIITVWEPGVHLPHRGPSGPISDSLGCPNRPRLMRSTGTLSMKGVSPASDGRLRVRRGAGLGPRVRRDLLMAGTCSTTTMKHYLETIAARPWGTSCSIAVLSMTPAEAWVQLMSTERARQGGKPR